jgi:glucose dehydrogenase
MQNNKLESNAVYKNLNRQNKFLGIIDYKTLVILLGYMWGIWELSGLLFNNLMYRGYMLIFLSIPILGIVYANKSEDNISYVIYCVLKYLVSPKHYAYKLKEKKYWNK